MLNQVASGEAALVVGTHAVIQEQVRFKNLALAIVDEQHRFGVLQRLALRRKLAEGIDAWPPQGDAAPSGGSEPRAAGSAKAPILIIAHQPTWGLDVGAVMFVQQQLINARDAGAAVLLISDDLDEVLALGDRVAVMHDGQLSEARRAEDWTREAIGLAMAGAAH